MKKTAAVFLSLVTGNVLTFRITLYRSFSIYIGIFHVSSFSHKHKNDYKTKVWPKKNCFWLEKHIAQPRVIAQTCGLAFRTLNSAFLLLWRLQNLKRWFGKVFENLGCLFWNKYSDGCLSHRETLGIFENLVCKKHTYTLTYI